jgi:hypothetical protein
MDIEVLFQQVFIAEPFKKVKKKSAKKQKNADLFPSSKLANNLLANKKKIHKIISPQKL